MGARNKLGLTQKELAAATGISLTRIKVLEAGDAIGSDYASLLASELLIPIHRLCEVSE